MRAIALTALVGFPLIGVPLATHAGPIDDILIVEYEGTVDAIFALDAGIGSLGSYSIGDKISGSLRIDISKAPLDHEPSERIGDFAGSRRPNGGLGGPSDFVSGHAPARATSQDGVLLRNFDDVPSGDDGFWVEDFEIGVEQDASGREFGVSDRLNLFAFSTDRDFISSDWLQQQFDLGADELVNTTAGGSIRAQRGPLGDLSNAVGGTVSFVLSRLSVKPGRCEVT